MNRTERDLKMGSEYPFDGERPQVDWAHLAARAIARDLGDRAGIKHEMGKVDDDVRCEIVDAHAALIRAAYKLVPVTWRWQYDDGEWSQWHRISVLPNPIPKRVEYAYAHSLPERGGVRTRCADGLRMSRLREGGRGMSPLPANRIGNVRRRADRARHFPTNTCPASRHVHMIADYLLLKRRSNNVEEVWDAEHIAGSLYSVLESLWKARTELERLKGTDR